jgi:protein TonB
MFDIQVPPSFPGGEKELLNYLSQNIQYPADASEKKISGIVALTFVVNKDGSISDVQIVQEIGGGCGEEAKRVVESMPNWIPGKLRGEPVRVRFTLPIRFKMD